MTPREYAEWTSTTAVYPDECAMEYLQLGLISELGELAGVLKKQLRGDTDPGDALAELGDCFWYAAQLLGPAEFAQAGTADRWHAERLGVNYLLLRAAQGEGTVWDAWAAARRLYQLAYALGSTPHDVMAANVHASWRKPKEVLPATPGMYLATAAHDTPEHARRLVVFIPDHGEYGPAALELGVGSYCANQWYWGRQLTARYTNWEPITTFPAGVTS